MTEQLKAPSANVARSIGANWLWYSVVIASGFVLPRLVDRFQGPELLGIWDFGWSLITYIGLLSLGVSSAVNCHVALYRTAGRWDRLNESVSASLLLLLAAATAGLAMAVVLAAWIPALLPQAGPDAVQAARWVVLLLGLKSALQLPGGVFNGVITGCERFDVLNGIRIARDLAALGAMAALLVAGFGIAALAAVLLVSEVLGEVAKFVAAFRLCPRLRLSWRHCHAAAFREVLAFGGKTFTQGLASGAVYQGSSLLVGIYLGPVALAVYARQRSLVLHLLRFVKQYAQVFSPRSSVLLAADQPEELRRVLVQSARVGLYVALPPSLVLLLQGGPLLHVWMGPDYAASGALAVMAAGHLFSVSQLGVYSVLMGLSRHGLPAAFDLAAAGVSVVCGAVLLGPLHGGLVAAAAAMTVPVAISGGLLTPWYACRCLRLPLRTYIAAVVPGPLASALPLAAVLAASQFLLGARPPAALAIGTGGGLALTAAVYAIWVLPEHLRQRLLSGLRRSWSGAASPVGARGASDAAS